MLVNGTAGATKLGLLDTEHELALALCARRVDGLIMIPTSDDHSYLLSEMRAGVPVVFADRWIRRAESLRPLAVRVSYLTSSPATA